jgi:hypothetical protein
MAEEPVSREENFNAISSGAAGLAACIVMGGFFALVMIAGAFNDPIWFFLGLIGTVVICLYGLTIVRRLTRSLLYYGEYLARLHNQLPAPLETPKDTPDPQP